MTTCPWGIDLVSDVTEILALTVFEATPGTEIPPPPNSSQNDPYHNNNLLAFTTSYGLRVEFSDLYNVQPRPENQDPKIYQVHLALQHRYPGLTFGDPPAPKDLLLAIPRKYLIFPDPRTSYLWQDNSDPTNQVPDMYHIDEENIEEWYPTLSEPFSVWRQRYEDNFEKNELDLRSGAEVFLDVKERVRWYTEGFLLAAWLVLQQGVDSVVYQPDRGRYFLEKGGLDGVFNKFLGEMEGLVWMRGGDLESKC